MISVIGGALAAIGKGFSSWTEGRARVKKAKVDAKVAKWEAKAAYHHKVLEAESNWDLEALRQSQHSWKDEVIMLIIFAPLVVWWFIPEQAQGWGDFVSDMPYWYQVIMFGIIAASFGLRWFFAGKAKIPKG